MKILSSYKNSYAEISDINHYAQKPESFIARCEKNYYDQIDAVVDQVISAYGRYRVLLVAGPSSSGKTTTSHKLSEAFARIGIHAPVASLDDFLLGMKHYPKLSDGSPDMESVYTLDLPLINSTLKQLIETGKATLPVFDFINSCRSEETTEVNLGKNGILIVEGIHALNPMLTEVLRQNAIYRVYVSTRTKFWAGEKELLTPKDTRLMRRMVRDNKFRGRTPIETLRMWKDVLSGEEKYLYLFRDSVDYKIDSSLDYEGCVFHHYILPEIAKLKGTDDYDPKLDQIVDILEAFDDIDCSYIPKQSLMREFIGD